MIPPMNEVASHIMKDMMKRYLVGEDAVMRKARQMIIRKNGKQGQFLVESAPYFLARMGGQGGARTEGKPILPPGVTSMETAYREGFRTGGLPVIVPERDYPGLTVQQIADVFAVQARDLYRAETRSSTVGPDLSALVDPRPATARNLEAQDRYDERLLERQRIMRTSYSNTVFPCIEMTAPETVCVHFTEARGRHPETTPRLEIGPTNTASGLCFTKKQGDEPQELIALHIRPTTPVAKNRFLQGCLDLAAFLETNDMLAMVCTKGPKAMIYLAGGPHGQITPNQVYDILAVKGQQVGNPAPNSSVAFKDIQFKFMGITVERESFTLRENDVVLLPLSLDYRPAKPRESTTKPFENSHNFDEDSGMVILPITNADNFVPGYDDHPSVVQYRMGAYVPAVVEFLRDSLIAFKQKEVDIQLVEGGDEWKDMRKSNSQVKEGDENDLLAATDVFAIPPGHEVVMVYDGNTVKMGVGQGKFFTGTPQTNDLELFSQYMNLEPYEAKGILLPSDESSFTLINKALAVSEETEEMEAVNAFMTLQVRVYGMEGTIGGFRPLGLPSILVCRNQSDSFVSISERRGDLTFSEMIQDELDKGISDRILIRFNDAPERNLYPLRFLDAAIIGFDIEGKNPQNGIVGNVLLGLSSHETVKVRKGGKASSTKSELYNPIGVVGAFADFTIDEKKALFDMLLDASTHPGYKEGYMMVNPEKLNMVVRIAHKGVQRNIDQPVFRLVTELKQYQGKKVPFKKTMYDFEGEGLNLSEEERRELFPQATPGTTVFDRAQIIGLRRPDVVPGESMLFDVGKRELPVLRSPNVQGFVVEVKGLEDKTIKQTIEDKKNIVNKYSKIIERLTMKVPLQQLPIRNPPLKLAGPEPEFDDFDGPLDVSAALTLSLAGTEGQQ